MLNRVVEICQENRYLSLNRGFLVIKEGDVELGSVPLDDIAVLVLSAQSITITKNILNALSEKGCVTVLCGKNYIPQSMVIPEFSHYLFSKILKTQIQASQPLKKRIWQQVVMSKIRHQAHCLKINGKDVESKKLYLISKSVNSGDTNNRESYAAKLYWKALFGSEFIRNKDGDGINALLNYGYAIMRAAMTRAICASGLLPTLGIHHDNISNQFCLSDDLFEVYRPLVDCIVCKIVQEGNQELTPEVKKTLAKTLQVMVHTTEGSSPAVTSMQYLSSSYVKSLETKTLVITLPDWEGNENGITIIE